MWVVFYTFIVTMGLTYPDFYVWRTAQTPAMVCPLLVMQLRSILPCAAFTYRMGCKSVEILIFPTLPYQTVSIKFGFTSAETRHPCLFDFQPPSGTGQSFPVMITTWMLMWTLLTRWKLAILITPRWLECSITPSMPGKCPYLPSFISPVWNYVTHVSTPNQC